MYKFECSKLDRKCEISTVLTEFSLQITQRPIEFTVGGFCCLNQLLLTTVRNDFPSEDLRIMFGSVILDHLRRYDVRYAVGSIFYVVIWPNLPKLSHLLSAVFCELRKQQKI